jgi:hypothetical protein
LTQRSRNNTLSFFIVIQNRKFLPQVIKTEAKEIMGDTYEKKISVYSKRIRIAVYYGICEIQYG